MQKRRIRQVWHLTRLAQLSEVLRAGGLLSRSRMDALGILYGMSGWGSTQKSEEMKDYICCSVVRPWGMSSQDPDSKVLITMQPRLLWRDGTLFSGRWSSFGDISLATLLNNKDLAAFDIMFPNETSSIPAPAPGEFLVPDCIPLSEFFPNIYFHSQTAQNEAMESCRGVVLTDGANVADKFRLIVSPWDFRGSS